jgi:hypothetical protein
MNDSNHQAPSITTIEAARLLLEKMGVGAADLFATPAARPEVPEGYSGEQERYVKFILSGGMAA